MKIFANNQTFPKPCSRSLQIHSNQQGNLKLKKEGEKKNGKNGNVTLESKNSIKCLGVLVDKNLTWKYQIDAITAKITNTFTTGLISNLRHSPPRHIQIYIYQTLIHPHLNFGLAAWDQTSKTSLNEILILQEKVLRMMYFTDIREHAIPLFLDADILPVSFMYYKTVASLMQDITNNNSPTNLSNLFEKTSTIHSYSYTIIYLI